MTHWKPVNKVKHGKKTRYIHIQSYSEQPTDEKTGFLVPFWLVGQTKEADVVNCTYSNEKIEVPLPSGDSIHVTLPCIVNTKKISEGETLLIDADESQDMKRQAEETPDGVPPKAKAKVASKPKAVVTGKEK